MAWVCQHAMSNLLGASLGGPSSILIPDEDISCVCQHPHTVLDVTCVYMDCLKEIKVQHCQKHPTAVQLLGLGLFPSAPVQPGLAVSLVMLEWACMLFLHLALNVHAWADTAEIMLKCQGYSFENLNFHSFHHCS